MTASPLQVAYVLAGDGGTYADVCAVSLLFLAHTNPGVRAILVIDQRTGERLRAISHPALRLAQEIVEVVVPDEAAAVRSRHLKTSLRSHIQGRFVFLDGDAIPLGSLAPLFATKADFAGALDRHRGSPAYDCSPAFTGPLAKRMGWLFPPKLYVNSGVMFWNDTEAAMRLGEDWHALWKQQLQTTGEHRDQPGLAQALAMSQASRAILPVRFNAIPEAAPCYLRDCVVAHYFLSAGEPTANSGLDLALRQLRACDWQPNPAQLDSLIASCRDHPWMDRWAPPREQYQSWLWQALARDWESSIILGREAIRHLRSPLEYGRFIAQVGWRLPLALFRHGYRLLCGAPKA